jgi:hypothetical protein
MENLVLAIAQGVWIMGRLDVDKNRINDPMRFMTMRKAPNSPETILMLEYFPGKPLFWVIKGDYAYYPVKDEEMIAMYVKATTGLIVPEKSKISLVS